MLCSTCFMLNLLKSRETLFIIYNCNATNFLNFELYLTETVSTAYSIGSYSNCGFELLTACSATRYNLLQRLFCSLLKAAKIIQKYIPEFNLIFFKINIRIKAQYIHTYIFI